MRSTRMVVAMAYLVAGAAWAATDNLPAPLADVHLHYNWDQEITASDAIRLLQAQNVRLAVVSSTPPELALELQRAGGDWILPFFRPYLAAGRRHSWFNDPAVLPAARKALASGQYAGIGEFHLIAGLGPGRDHPMVQGLIELGIEFDVPLLVHIETSSHRFFLPLCKRHPRARFLLAHAGGLLDATAMGALLHACPNVWTEFSARDSWRYIESQIVDADGHLLAAWRDVIEEYPDRFMVGSDPVWPVEYLHNWDEADTGWQRLDEFLNFHRRWLKDLPPSLAEKLRLTNARRFFRQAAK